MPESIFDRLLMPPVAMTLGGALRAINPEAGTIEAGLTAGEAITSATGAVQAGFVAAMLDDTMGRALFAMGKGEIFAPALDLNVSFIGPARRGPFVGPAPHQPRQDHRLPRRRALWWRRSARGAVHCHGAGDVRFFDAEASGGWRQSLIRSASIILPLLLFGCSEQRSFDSAAWKADALTEADQHLDVRRSMVADIERRFRPGTGKAEILSAFGPSEYAAGASCEYPGVDSCLGYQLGASLADYDFLIFAFAGDRLVHISHYRS